MTIAGVDRLSARKLQAALDQAPRRLYRHMRSAFRDSGADWEGVMQRRLRGAPLKARTGSLRRSIRQEVRGSTLGSLELRCASTSRYAKVHELGTVGAGGLLPDITPKRAKALTIPLRDNLTAAGVPRHPSASALRASGTTFLLKVNGKAFIVKREGDTLRWLWILKDRVALPPRLGFFGTWRALTQRRRARLDKAVVDTLVGREVG